MAELALFTPACRYVFDATPANMVDKSTLADSTIATVQLPSARMISVVVTKTDGIIEFYLDGSLLENDSAIVPRLTCIGGAGLGDLDSRCFGCTDSSF